MYTSELTWDAFVSYISHLARIGHHFDSYFVHDKHLPNPQENNRKHKYLDTIQKAKREGNNYQCQISCTLIIGIERNPKETRGKQDKNGCVKLLKGPHLCKCCTNCTWTEVLPKFWRSSKQEVVLIPDRYVWCYGILPVESNISPEIRLHFRWSMAPKQQCMGGFFWLTTAGSFIQFFEHSTKELWFYCPASPDKHNTSFQTSFAKGLSKRICWMVSSSIRYK